MTAGDVFSAVASVPVVQSLRERVERGESLSFSSVSPAAQPFFAVLLTRLFPTRPIVVVTESLRTQEIFQQDIETWVAESRAAGATPLGRPRFFPAWEVLPHEPRLPHVDVVSERLETLVGLSNRSAAEPAPIIVSSVTALLQKTFQSGEIARRTRSLRRGDSLDPLDLVEWLENQGYEPEAQVTQKGDISMRGGILDLWPLTSPWPVRLEFVGNQLESLREFDPLTQVSRDPPSQGCGATSPPAGVVIPPGGELGLLKADEQAPVASLLEYLPAGAIFLLCEPEMLRDQAGRYEEQVQEADRFFISCEQFQEEMKKRGVVSVEVSEIENVFIENAVPDAEGFTGKDEMAWQGLEVFRPIGDRRPEPHIAEAQRKEFFDQLHRWLRQDYAVHLFCNNEGERRRFQEIWQEYGLDNSDSLRLHIGPLARGFLFEPAKLAVVTDAEIFGRYKVQRPRRLKSPQAQLGNSLLDINFSEIVEGDYVVHLQHGIGRYLGLRDLPAALGQKPVGENTQVAATGEECLVIEYAPGDPLQPAPKLYVPVSESHLVSKYVGAGRARPPLNMLGGTRWAKTKALAQEAVRDLAGEMLSIQAVRSTQEGHAFPPDATWQHEFEDSFIYEETPDQWRAIVATKKDMETPKPMDRLICGDVGYGKTEVAIRAAFKSALAGKQVAVLVPTTVLAQQHFNTFRERMADYPLRIELLSRFRSRRDQDRVIRDLAGGSVDIVIGTHRLVQDDVVFKDLGLVVIDEEQRFGVLHKEKFKRLRTLVDVLTMTATPIPRTLYLALAGARDMSTIETPPQDRLPVETLVAQYDERLIRDAIQRELNRGGQVFYLHNRVFDIEAVAQRLRALVPQARIAVGHGQMHSDQLEEVMTTFVNGQTDVLLSTTIIESGLDIPNANTIIIDRADRFGLSDLYQLRGRVGRFKHQAYAYLLLPRHAGLLTDARKRINAIKQYSSLGSGFKIAMRDLEIRGAGNLLGSEQSGHIAAVGFELYCQLLKQSVSSLKGEKVQPRLNVNVRLDFLAAGAEEEHSNPQKPAACFPGSYIPEAQQRIEIYRKLAQVNDAASWRALKNELRDRFGPLPPAVDLVLRVADLKIVAAQHGVSLIETQEDKLMLTRHNDFVMAGGKFPRLTKPTARGRLDEIKKLLLALC
ncbi:MAG: transcription-repair coupling factor [Verrucomicrobiota bacterium]|jgi:transcription-repair coupling factor (superfamily II helicase)